MWYAITDPDLNVNGGLADLSLKWGFVYVINPHRNYGRVYLSILHYQLHPVSK